MKYWIGTKIALIIVSILVFIGMSACTSSNQVPGTEPANSSTTSPAKTEVMPTTKPAAPEITGAPDTLAVVSYPPGYQVFIIPHADLSGFSFDVIKMTDDKYFRGNTPLNVKLDPGKYTISVGDQHNPSNFRSNGEDSIISVINPDGNQIPMAQTYIITQNAGYCSLVTALFWSKEQTLADFVRGLTGPEEFPAKSEFMGSFFEKYQIPAEDRPLLITMLSKTGKAVWYGSDQTRPAMYMYYQCILPEYQLAVWPAETQSK